MLRPQTGLIVSFLLLVAAPAVSQLEPAGSEITVAQGASVFHRAPAVAAGEAGFVVVWQKHGGGAEDWDISGRLYDRSGTAVGAEFAVNAVTAGCQQRPSVAMDRSGNFIVAWESDGQDGSGRGIIARRFASDGAPLGSELLVNVTTAGDQRAPGVERDPSGSFLVAWQSESTSPDGDSWGVFARGFNASGAPASSEFLVNATAAGAQSAPAVAWLHGSPVRYAVVWQSQGQDGSGSGVYRRTFTLGGLAQSGEQAVSATASGSQTHPSVAADASGNFTVTWQAGGRVLARRFSVASAPLGAEVGVTGNLPESGRHPSLAGAAGGDFVVVWERGGGEAPPTIAAQLFDHRQIPRGPQIEVSTGTSGSLDGPAASASAGRVAMAWAGTPAEAQDSAALARRYGLPGLDFHTLAPCRVIDTRNPIGPFGGPVLVSGVERMFTIPASSCGVPASARVLSLNLTAIDSTANGYIAIYPGDTIFPSTSSVNCAAGQIRANNAVAGLSRNGLATLTALAGAVPGMQVHLVIDVNGYFE